MSWDCLVMDTDFHKIKDESDNFMNKNKKIVIENNVWIGCRCLILKGVFIKKNCVIAAGTTICKSIIVSNAVIGGSPVRVLNEKINWN